MNRHRQTQQGFTIIELMIAIAVAAILVTMGVPALRAYMTNTQLVAQANGLLGAFNYARGQAVTENDLLGVRISPGAALNSGIPANSTWNDGWTVWRDKDNDGVLDVDTDEDINEVLRVGEGSGSADISVTSLWSATNSEIGEIQYQASGMINARDTAVFRLCSSHSLVKREIRITRTGRGALTTDVNGTKLNWTCPI